MAASAVSGIGEFSSSVEQKEEGTVEREKEEEDEEERGRGEREEERS